MMNIELPNEIWSIIFHSLTSSNRARICTVSMRWSHQLISIADASHVPMDKMLEQGEYHPFVRLSYHTFNHRGLTQLDIYQLRILQRIPRLSTALECCQRIAHTERRRMTSPIHNDKLTTFILNSMVKDHTVDVRYKTYIRPAPRHLNQYFDDVAYSRLLYGTIDQCYYNALLQLCMNNKPDRYIQLVTLYGLDERPGIDWKGLLKACNRLTSPIIISHIKQKI